MNFPLQYFRVIDKVPGHGEDGLYSFSSRPVTPRDKTGNLLVKFQAVSRSHQTQSHHYIRVNSKDRLSHIRRNINLQFKEYFERGFIFLSKTREILRSDERKTTIFDILPKIPVDKPTENFRYPDVEYKRVCLVNKYLLIVGNFSEIQIFLIEESIFFFNPVLIVFTRFHTPMTADGIS